MLWSLLFAIGIVQGIFLMVIFAKRSQNNRVATRLLQALLALFVLSNFDDLLLSTGWYKSVSVLFGFSLGAMFAYGPLFYLYIAAITDPAFSWKKKHWLHFLPALLSVLWNLAWFLAPAGAKVNFLDLMLGGTLQVRPFETGVSLFQILYFYTYVWLAYQAIKTARASGSTATYQVPLSRRRGWLYSLLIIFSSILVALIALTAWNFMDGYYHPQANFVFTLFTSIIIYFMAFKLILQPEMVTPGFSKKYTAVRFEDGEEQDLLSKLKDYVEEEKVFTDPDLKLGALAAQLNIPAHRLSMLINEHDGKSFSDFINQYRVQEFIARLNDPAYANYSLHGLALEVGFNSKSAFNAAFKKLTGKPPSSFKKSTPTTA